MARWIRRSGGEPRGIVTTAVYLAVLLLVSSWATPVRAEGMVKIGEVATRITRARVDLPKALRSALEREVAALPAHAKGSKRFVLSASLVKLEGRQRGATAGIECTVSAVLREERGGAIRAVLVGRAEADYDGDEAELGALEAAVRGAVASVPAAMR